MEIYDKKRTLMTGGEGDTWEKVLTVSYTFDYDAMNVHDSHVYDIYANFSRSKLIGSNSEYVIKVNSTLQQYDDDIVDLPRVEISIVSRNDPNGDTVPVKLNDAELASDFAMIDCDYHTGYWNAPNLIESGNVYCIDPDGNADYDIFVSCYVSNSGNEGDCPAGGDHDFSAVGQPGYSLFDYQCPNCKQTGYCYHQTTQCTKCGAYSDFVLCTNCGWQS